MDYGMGLEKPVVYIDLPPKARNDWWPALEMEPFESYVRDRIGRVVSPRSLATLPEIIAGLLADPAAFRSEVARLRQEWVFNLGHSPEAAAAAIVQLADTGSGAERRRVS
jgi:YidC/Oxa1 family membrane protein insertase